MPYRDPSLIQSCRLDSGTCPGCGHSLDGLGICIVFDEPTLTMVCSSCIEGFVQHLRMERWWQTLLRLLA